MESLSRVVLWRSVDGNSMDHVGLWRTAKGYLLKGVVVGMLEDSQPILAKYEVYCDDHWRTERVEVERQIGKDSRHSSLAVEGPGLWRDHTGSLLSLSECIDVDLEITPATNTLPIRRMKLEIGDSRQVTAAWVRTRDLSVQPLSQVYTRIDDRRYRYESSTGFSAEITVDDLGLVVTYPDGWERVTQLRPGD